MDGGGRAKQDARAESRVKNGDRERLRTPTHMQLVDDVQDVQMPREHGQRKRQTSGSAKPALGVQVFETKSSKLIRSYLGYFGR